MHRIVLTFLLLFVGCVGLFVYATSPTLLPKDYSAWQQFLCHINYSYIKLKKDPFCNEKVPESRIPLDIVIPVVEKDAQTLLLTIVSVKSNVMQPIGNIYLIAPESKILRDIAKRKGCTFILEDKVLPKFSNTTNRKGWIKQQYLKLNADSIVKNEYFLVIDADTILIRPQIFVKAGQEILNILGDYWFKRKIMVKKALGFSHFHNLDFTSHHMLFSKTKLAALKKHLEKIHRKTWYDALDSLDIPEGSFSEYELYGNFIAQQFKDTTVLVWGRNSLFPRDGVSNIAYARDYLCHRYKSLTMHSFLTITNMKE